MGRCLLVVRFGVTAVRSHRYQHYEDVGLLPWFIVYMVRDAAYLGVGPIVRLRADEREHGSSKANIFALSAVSGPVEILLGVFGEHVPVLCVRLAVFVVCFGVVFVVERVFTAEGTVRSRRKVRVGASNGEFILCRLTRRVRATVRFRPTVRREKNFTRVRVIFKGLVFVCGTSSTNVNVERVVLWLLISVTRECEDGKDGANAGRVFRIILVQRFNPYSPTVCVVARSVAILRFEGTGDVVGNRTNERECFVGSKLTPFFDNCRCCPVDDLTAVRDYDQDAFRGHCALRVLEVRVEGTITSIAVTNVNYASGDQVNLFKDEIRRQGAVCCVWELVVASCEACAAGASLD